jgi:hypothetical protein
MPDDPVTDETLARRQAAQGDAKCNCKAAPPAVQKSAARHRDANTGKAEPAAPTGRRVNVDGLTAVPADLSHLVPRDIRDGGQALQYLRDLAAGQDAGGGNGGAARGAPGPDLSVTYRGTGGGLSPALQAVDAGRLQLQGRGLGRMSTGGKGR